MTRPLLDTHVWVWWMLGDSRLSAGEREALDALVEHTGNFLHFVDDDRQAQAGRWPSQELLAEQGRSGPERKREVCFEKVVGRARR